MLCENIASDIQQKIESGELSVGTKLKSERILAEEYKVSRNVVREALKTLSQRGLISIEPGKGAYVSKADEDKMLEYMRLIMINNCDDMLEVLEMREIFELAALRRIIGKVSQESIKRLESLYQQMEETEHNIIEYSRLDEMFHKTILDQVDNHLFRMVANSFYELTLKEIFNLMCAYPNRIAIAQKDHREMIDALKQENLNQLLEVTRRHMDGIEYEIRRLKKKG